MHEMHTFTPTLCRRNPTHEMPLSCDRCNGRVAAGCQRPHRQACPCAIHRRALSPAPRSSHRELSRLRCVACRHRSHTHPLHGRTATGAWRRGLSATHQACYNPQGARRCRTLPLSGVPCPTAGTLCRPAHIDDQATLCGGPHLHFIGPPKPYRACMHIGQADPESP